MKCCLVREFKVSVYVINVRSITNVYESCALSILGSLLVDGEKSPFYQSLLESGIGSDYAPTTGSVDWRYHTGLVSK